MISSMYWQYEISLLQVYLAAPKIYPAVADAVYIASFSYFDIEREMTTVYTILCDSILI